MHGTMSLKKISRKLSNSIALCFWHISVLTANYKSQSLCASLAACNAGRVMVIQYCQLLAGACSLCHHKAPVLFYLVT